MSALLRLLELAAAILAIVLGWNVRNPMLAEFRPWPLVAALLIGAIVLLTVTRGLRRGAGEPGAGAGRLLTSGLAALAILTAIAGEGRFHEARAHVLGAEPARLATLGRHIIVSYRDVAEVRRLIEAKAIGGIFLTSQNVRGRSLADIREEVAGLQALARAQGYGPLWVATDQEGGIVSRMTPPLAFEPPLKDVVAANSQSRPRAIAVEDYARRQGRALAELGVNLNFAPVADLDFGVENAGGRFTKLGERAIAADADVVASVTTRYCAGLAENSIHCTLKHFPGLGRVRGDTHVGEVRLEASLAELDAADWVPFRRVLPLPSAVLMVGHVRLTALDPDRPASLSKRVIGGLVREQWGHEGLIVTDDMCMGAVVNSRRSIGQAAVQAINAGADLVLVGWDSAQVYPVLAALIDAERSGRIDAGVLPKSAQRLDAGLTRAQRPPETR